MTTLTLTIPAPLESKLRARAAAQGRDLASVALDLVEQALHDDTPTLTARDLTHEQRLQNLQEYLKDRPRIDVEVDDSRECIYQGRGE